MADMSTMDFDKNVRHLSFICDPTKYFDWDVPSSLFKLKSLQSLILTQPVPKIYPPQKLRVSPSSFLDRLAIGSPCLRVLDLKESRIKELPRSLGDLTCLRYLDLSSNPIHKLPNSLKHLKNLLVLDLCNCGELQELPKGINKLKKLRHLKLQNCSSLTSMPMGLENLTDLQTLSMFVAGGQSCLGGSLAELERLNNLRGYLEIRVVGRSETAATEASVARLGMKENLRRISIELENSTKDDELVLESLQPHANLNQLCIYGYAGERLPSWMMNQLHLWLPNLTRIDLCNCKDCKHLCSFGRLPHLEYLTLVFLENVEYIEETTASSGDITKCEPIFPRLHELKIERMEEAINADKQISRFTATFSSSASTSAFQ